MGIDIRNVMYLKNGKVWIFECEFFIRIYYQSQLKMLQSPCSVALNQ